MKNKNDREQELRSATRGLATAGASAHSVQHPPLVRDQHAHWTRVPGGIRTVGKLSMSASCCNHNLSAARPLLWLALRINAGMFAVEVVAGLIAGSVSLHADALDFLGDSFNYAISIAVLTMALTWRARAALLKGATMGVLGLWVIGEAAWHVYIGRVPEPVVMGAVGFAALLANA